MGRGQKRSRGGGGGDFGDQYGESMVSQDRGDRQGLPGKGGTGGGMSGGGEAGGSGARGGDLTAVRHVPKFLKGFEHLLGRKRPQEPEEEAAQLATDEAAEAAAEAREREEGDREALEQAVVDNPELVALYPELAGVAARAQAAQAKERGNRAFAAKDFQTAAACFSEAIALHPEDAVFYSNRAAARLALRQHTAAAADAREAVRLRPEWHRGWARLGAAHAALQEWSEAKDAYDEALRLEPSDEALRAARHRAEVEEAKAEADRSVRFKQSRQRQKPPRGGGGAGGGKQGAAPGVRNKALLSFNEDEEEA